MRVASRNDPRPATEIAHEVDALRDARHGTSESLGHIHFRMRTLLSYVGGDSLPFGAELRAAEYATPALPPPSPWLGAAVPAEPLVAAQSDSVMEQGDGDDRAHAGRAADVLATVTPGDTVAVRWWVVQTLGVDRQWRQRVVLALGKPLAITHADAVGALYIAVTPLSRTGMAGTPALYRVEGDG
jgi:hypothetical protein